MEMEIVDPLSPGGLKKREPLTECGNGNIRVSDSHGPQTHSEKDKQLYFNKLISRAKEKVSQGKLEAALEYYKKAYRIDPKEKLQKKITKMEAYIRDHEDSGDASEESDMIHIGKGFYLYKALCNKLYPHQKQGLLWMWSLYQKKKGGILGDDMGLGKTIQVISFLSGMFDSEHVHAVLIVMPVSLILNWEKEFEKWAPGIRVSAFHGSSKRERERALGKVQRRGGVCLTSYGMVVSSWQVLSQKDDREFKWDYVILDEGHKIKNPTKTSKGVRAIPCSNRIILTGTPIQNNLGEMWALFDYVQQGALLGTARTFKMEFDNPITRSRAKDATMGEKRLGAEMAETLRKIIAPYFLRRTKAEVQAMNEDKENAQEGSSERSATPLMPSLTRKNDFVIWVYLSEIQKKIYQDFSSSDEVKELLMVTTRSPLTALIVLKKICDHPRLLSSAACMQLGLDGQDFEAEYLNHPASQESAANRIHNITDDILINESGKMLFLVDLLDNLKQEGHRCLVFSQSRKMLDIIQKVITNRGHKVARMDGTVTQLDDRERIIKKFESDSSYSVFLLTTQVGGVGLTLTAADRVVIFDPSWNPATDAQAVDRVFRIGQDKNVVVYRLITCGSIEEKIYRRQVFKESITRQTTGTSKNPYRYFSQQELKELFILDDPTMSVTQQQLQDMHSSSRISDNNLDAHVAFLHTLAMYGLTDHDRMFSHEAAHDEEEDDEGGTDYIQSRAQKALETINMESQMNTQMQETMSKYPPNYLVHDSLQQPPIVAPSRDDTKRSMPSRPPAPTTSSGPLIDLAAVDTESEDSEIDEGLNQTLADLTLEDVDMEDEAHQQENGKKEEVPSSPERQPIIIEEQMIVSPDASRPIITTQRVDKEPFTNFNELLKSECKNESNPASLTEDGPDIRADSTDFEQGNGRKTPHDSLPFGKEKRLEESSVIVLDSASNTPQVKHLNPASGSVDRICIPDSDEDDGDDDDGGEMVVDDSFTSAKGRSEASTSKSDSNNISDVKVQYSPHGRARSVQVYDSPVVGPTIDMEDSPVHTAKKQSRRTRIASSSDEEEISASKEKEGYNTAPSSPASGMPVIISSSEGEDEDGNSSNKIGRSAKIRKEGGLNISQGKSQEANSSQEEEGDDVISSQEEEEEEAGSSTDDFINNDSEELEEEEESVEEEEEGSEEDSDEENEIEDSEEEMPAEKIQEFEHARNLARQYYENGRHNQAMVHILKALEIHHDDSLKLMALKIAQKRKKGE
ncbi:DNA excision repair protein ERCC-6-like [Lingula anatina]|uniref:DNA excision repair protein ERCC-6-like n=1 Tax=Lingula anatina TaxID=7574 RepID=A0A1S3H0V6_LINAN|nr:DNA excision repair protein ERCC-6-like [Lingula anatina]XP_013379639.1 DNA excision repair protein ERCC-6-like [Lingula anatina]|eukprot:XP_013379638.1 DNA excision repair protein ERCC-6-like [Lingula anatina]